MNGAPRNVILVGDALDQLRRLPDACIDAVLTSPPYFATRDYGVPGQIGMEATVTEWVARLQAVFAEVARVLKPTGSLWLNLADSYSRHPRYGTPAKGLLAAPERLLLALLADGWLLRNRVIWSKPNPTPTSVKDRLTAAHEHVYFLVRQRSYYFRLDPIREPHRSAPARTLSRDGARPPGWSGPLGASRSNLARARLTVGHPLGKNPGDVWRIPTRPGYGGAHFATFPPALAERPILATVPETACATCGAPTGCSCVAGTVPGLLLDPFAGTGTALWVAQQLGRDWLGVEISERYAALAAWRLGANQPPSTARERAA
ncbi:MAG TPA: site-specific DNA-methyltransferase [Candidatus Angelobacter sp.]|nr:site-specific DNA-methyltransferase [Candidatus Angelobacter sp.]